VFEPIAGAHENFSFVRQINNAAVINVESLARGINPNGGPHRGRASAARDFKRRVHHRIRVAWFPAEKQVVVILFYVAQVGGVISGLMRTPLNAIIGLTEMMVKNAARFGTEKAQEPLQRVNRAGTHLLGLINQVLDLSKIEAGKLELNPQTVQLAPLINDVISTAGSLLHGSSGKGTDATYELPMMWAAVAAAATLGFKPFGRLRLRSAAPLAA
jgi:signal transduction histidine kinase